MSIQKEKRDLIKEKIRSPSDAARGLEPPTTAPSPRGQQKCLDKALHGKLKINKTRGSGSLHAFLISNNSICT